MNLSVSNLATSWSSKNPKKLSQLPPKFTGKVYFELATLLAWINHSSWDWRQEIWHRTSVKHPSNTKKKDFRFLNYWKKKKRNHRGHQVWSQSVFGLNLLFFFLDDKKWYTSDHFHGDVEKKKHQKFSGDLVIVIDIELPIFSHTTHSVLRLTNILF